MKILRNLRQRKDNKMDIEQLRKLRGKWRVFPKVAYVNFPKEYPNAGKDCWVKWFSFQILWSGKLWYIACKGRTIILDFRVSWLADMLNDSPQVSTKVSE